MDVAEIEKLLRRLGTSITKIGNNGWVQSPCVFARFKHAGGVDRHPSFGILVAPNGSSRFRCFTCGVSGDMTSLLWRLEKLSGDDYSDTAEFVRRTNAPNLEELSKRLERATYEPAPATEVAGIQAPVTQVRLPMPVDLPGLPEEHLKNFGDLTDEAIRYLLGTKRRLTLEVIREFGLRYHKKARRIAIPIRDCQGRLVGVTGRSLPHEDIPGDEGSFPKFLHSTGFRRDYYLFGENKIEKGTRGYLVEGPFDVMFLRLKRYPNVLGVLGSWMSKHQVEKMCQWFSDVVIVPDGDQPGYEAAERWEEALVSRLPVKVAATPCDKDPDQLSDEELEEILPLDNPGRS